MGNNQEDDLREIRDQTGQMTVTLARIEERLKVYDETHEEVIRILRGDGNGESGMIARMSSNANEVRGLRQRMDRVERELMKIMSKLNSVSPARWKSIAAIVGAAATVLTAVAALLTAVFR